MNKGEVEMKLVDYLKDINNKSREKMAKNPNWMIGLIVEDPKHWAGYGVHTVEDFQRWELETYIYDAHKDAFGVKGRHYDFASMTMEDLQKEADYISAEVERSINEEKEAEDENLKKFEQRIANTIENGASDRETAIRWILDAEGLVNEQDPEYICYSLGLSYNQKNMFQDMGVSA